MTISLHRFSREFLFLIIAIYFAQGTFYPTGSVIAKLCLLLILVISFFYLIKFLMVKSQKELYSYILLLFLLLNFFGYIFQGVLREGFSGIYFSQFKHILIALLPFFPFYYFAYKGFLLKKPLLRFFIIMLPIVIASFYSSKSNILSESLSDSENIVTNVAYFFAALIPYVFLWGKRKTLSIISLILLLFFIIQGAKRGALVTGVMGTIVFVYYQLTTIDPKRRLQSLIISIIGVLLLIYFSYDFYISNDFLINRVESIDEGGSGRSNIYSNLLNNWTESNNIFNYLFGFGFVSTIKYSGTNHLAHNDWLELLTNFGLIGVSIYLLLFFAAIRFTFYSNVEREDKLMMVAIILIWLFKTMFSMYYTVDTTLFASILLGYLFGNYQHNKNIKSKYKIYSDNAG